MPYTKDWETEGVVTTFFGTVSINEVINADKEFYEDPRSDKSKYQITDFSGIVPESANEIDIQTIAAFDAGSSMSIPLLKVALITNDQHVKSLCQKYIYFSRRLNSTWKFKICEDIQSARKWISESTPLNAYAEIATHLE